MSGVLAFCAATPALPPLDVVRAMARRVAHRPYHRIDTSTPDPHVGMGRLDAGVVSHAPRAHRSADGTVTLYLTGEFHLEPADRAARLRSLDLPEDAGDGALALSAYCSGGVEALAALDGAFVALAWDARLRELILVNDRFGLYPHYLAVLPGALVVAPEIKGVLAAPGVPRRLDRTAVGQYIRFQLLLGHRTWLEHVSVVPPASWLRYGPETDRMTLRRYWDWDSVGHHESITVADAADECDRLFKRAVDLRVTPALRTGVYLSGGLDSRLILAYLDRQLPVTTLTYGAAGCRDVHYAQRVARRRGTRHLWCSLEDGRWVLEHADDHLALTEGQHSFVHAHGISTLSAAREAFDVNLSGMRPTSVLSSFPTRHPASPARMALAPAADLERLLFEYLCRYHTWPGLSEAEAADLLRGPAGQDLTDRAVASFREEVARACRYRADLRDTCFKIENRERRFINNHLVFARAAIEVRCPFYDYAFLTFVMSLPPEVRYAPELRRRMFGRRLPSLARIPRDADRTLPHPSRLLREGHATFWRGVHLIGRALGLPAGRPTLYADYEQYLRTDLRAWAEHVLFDSRTLERGFYNPDALRALWQRHLSGEELWTIGKIAPLITLEMTLRLLCDEPDGQA